jgi:LmbE family N-acetylglucosaminyl deacetylase
LSKSILVVAAHPDDEVLGCGGAIARWVNEGCTVHVAFLADGVTSREADAGAHATELAARRAASRAACNILGVTSVSFGDHPDNQLDTVSLLTLSKEVSALVETHRPELVLTHHAGDLNVDHRQAHEAVATACRPQPGHVVKRILCFEVASSTGWRLDPQHAFHPNVFVDITSTLEKKLDGLRAYDVEMRKWPHARSVAAAEHLARWRGATVGVAAAEAFALARDLS